uniref:Polyprotein n=1 Tax=Parsnip yellow fleck virus TaxID=12777 RepID=Q7LZW0_9SECO
VDGTLLLSQLAALSAMYAFWRGSLVLTFEINCSASTRGKLIVSVTPKGGVALAGITASHQGYGAEFDLGTSSTRSFTMPFVSTDEWESIGDDGIMSAFEGVWDCPVANLLVLHPITSIAESTPSVDIRCYLHPGPDFQLRGRRHIGTRVDPFHVSLYGSPGVGKSFVMGKLLDDVLDFMSEPQADRCYSKTPNEEYWSGYIGQTAVKCDDLGQDLSKGFSPTYNQIIQMKTNNCFIVPMADLANKGRTFTSKYIFSTTNVPGCGTKHGLADPGAFMRRRNIFVEVELLAPLHTFAGAEKDDIFRFEPKDVSQLSEYDACIIRTDKTEDGQCGSCLVSTSDKLDGKVFCSLVAGIDGVEYYEPLNMSTSEGYPLILNRPKDAHGKEYLFFPLICIECPKDERRALDKIYEKPKTRLFSILPVEFNMHARRLFLDFNVFVMANRHKHGIMVGINPHSREWSDLAISLASFSPYGFNGDFANFDGMFHPSSGAILRVPGGGPSGFPMTVIFNSFINLFYLQSAWIMLARFNGRQDISHPCNFPKYVRACVYGDDNIVAIKMEVLPWYNLQTVSEALFDYFGVTMTDGAKNKASEAKPYGKILEFDFLKRHFKADELIPSLFHAPLHKRSIEEQVYWIREG